ncbi:unnamed protein product [Rhizophagus irregularis]|nr:unnamed protein product [Rhizophagus irregularis]
MSCIEAYVCLYSDQRTSNKYNHFALCRYCRTRITNTKKLVTSHLKYCTKFEEQHNEDERDRILYSENMRRKLKLLLLHVLRKNLSML